MDFYDKIANFITKLQNLPHEQRKSIFFTVMTIAVLIAAIFLIISAKNSVSDIGQSLRSIDLPSVNLPNREIVIPDREIVIPDIDVNSTVSDELNNLLERRPIKTKSRIYP